MCRTPIGLAAVLLLSWACSKPSEPATVSGAQPAPPKLVSVAQPTAPPKAASAVSHPEYERAKTLIESWGGDGRRLEEARQLLLKVLEKDRSHAPTYVQLARYERQQGYQSGWDYNPDALSRASKLVHHALKLDPTLVEGHLIAARISIDRKNFDLALNTLERVEELAPGHPGAKVAHADIAIREQNPGKAKEIVRLAKEVLAAPGASDALRAEAYGQLITVYSALGHLDEVDGAHRERIKLLPQSAWAHGNYAHFLLRRGQVDAAIREAEQAVAILPYPIGVRTLADAYLRKADQLWNENKFAQSVTYIERIARMSGDTAEVHLRLGTMYERAAIRSKDAAFFGRARRAYEKALQLDGNLSEARDSLDRLAQGGH